MNQDDDLVELLQSHPSSSPAPDPSFLDALEQRLLALDVAGVDAGTGDAEPPGTRPSLIRRRRWGITLAGLIVVGATTVGLVVASSGGSGSVRSETTIGAPTTTTTLGTTTTAGEVTSTATTAAVSSAPSTVTSTVAPSTIDPATTGEPTTNPVVGAPTTATPSTDTPSTAPGSSAPTTVAPVSSPPTTVGRTVPRTTTPRTTVAPTAPPTAPPTVPATAPPTSAPPVTVPPTTVAPTPPPTTAGATTTTTTAPRVPVVISMTCTSDFSWIYCSWDKVPADAATLRLQRRVGTARAVPVSPAPGVHDGTYTDKTVVQLISYTYTLQIFDAAGNNIGHSNSVTISLRPPA